jgi:hypothetical protein
MFEWCVGLVVAPRTDIKKALFVKDWAACSKYYNHLGSIVNTMGGSIRPFKEHEFFSL